jgi:hypothetical protein
VQQKEFRRRSAIQPHQTFFQPCSLLTPPHNLVASVTPFSSNAFMNRLSRPSAIFRSSSSNRISNSFFRNRPHLLAFAVKMSTSREAEALQPVANGVYKPRYIDVGLYPPPPTFLLSWPLFSISIAGEVNTNG